MNLNYLCTIYLHVSTNNDVSLLTAIFSRFMKDFQQKVSYDIGEIYLRRMSMFKKPALLLSILCLILLSACGSGKENSSVSGGSSENAIAAEDELTITATNYSFDQEEYHLKKGVPVKIIFKNESGNHGILVPELELRLDAKTSSQVIIPEEAGTYEMTCAIMCGSGHSAMSARVIVE